MHIRGVDIRKRQGRTAFTLLELLVSMGVSILLMVLIVELFNNATFITTGGNRHMDTDAQARAVFDRMAIDFAQLVKRTDVDYFLKSSVAATDRSGNLIAASQPQVKNDQIAFFSEVDGYYTASSHHGGVSLVGYRVNGETSPALYTLQRLGCGLLWNGADSENLPLVFRPLTIGGVWPTAVAQPGAANYTDANWEHAGPQVFRFEYFYLLKAQSYPGGISFASQLSDVPWDLRIKGVPGVVDHTWVNGLQDVAAIGVVIAVIDSKSRALLANTQLESLIGKMEDFPQTDASGNNTAKPGDLESQWRSVIEDRTNGIPRQVISGIRVYQRYFYLPPGFSGIM